MVLSRLQDLSLHSTTTAITITAHNVTIFANPAQRLNCNRHHNCNSHHCFTSPIQLQFDDHMMPQQQQPMPVLTMQQIQLRWASIWQQKPILHIMLDSLIVTATIFQSNNNKNVYLDYSNTLLLFLQKLPMPPTVPDVYPKLGTIKLQNVRFEIYHIAKHNHQISSPLSLLPWNHNKQQEQTVICSSECSVVDQSTYCCPSQSPKVATCEENLSLSIRNSCTTSERNNSSFLLVAKFHVPQGLLDRLCQDTTLLARKNNNGGIEQMDVAKVLEESLVRGVIEDVLLQKVHQSLKNSIVSIIFNKTDHGTNLFSFLQGSIRKHFSLGEGYMKNNWSKLTHDADEVAKLILQTVYDDTYLFLDRMQLQLASSEDYIKHGWSNLMHDADAIVKEKTQSVRDDTFLFFNEIHKHITLSQESIKRFCSNLLNDADGMLKKQSQKAHDASCIILDGMHKRFGVSEQDIKWSVFKLLQCTDSIVKKKLK